MRYKLRNYLLLICLIALVGTAAYLYLRPVPPATPLSLVITPPETQTIALPWPAGGQAAIGAVGYGVLATHNAVVPVPVASIAKVITALAVLKQKPLVVGAQGPQITLDSSDVGYFNYYSANGGSAAKVEVGEKISEYQVLQGMLLPSANNLADSLTRWAFGTQAAYVSYANQMLKTMGIAHTTVGDTNGFSDTTTSTADDLVNIGLSAMGQPVIADVVSQPAATIPVAGDIKNINRLLGTNNIVGIKTGNTDKAGGCYLFASKRLILGNDVTVVGAVLGQPELAGAMAAAVPLLNAGDTGFKQITVIKRNQLLGSYSTPWGKTAQVTANNDLTLLAWTGQSIKIQNSLNPIKTPAKTGAVVGGVRAQSGGLAINSSSALSQALPGPTWYWRLTRH